MLYGVYRLVMDTCLNTNQYRIDNDYQGYAQFKYS